MFYSSHRNNSSIVSKNVLPIYLAPGNVEEFKRIFMAEKRASIETHYTDGRIEPKIWPCRKFTEESDVMRNLRSRAEFRQGEWQRRNIAFVRVIAGAELIIARRESLPQTVPRQAAGAQL